MLHRALLLPFAVCLGLLPCGRGLVGFSWHACRCLSCHVGQTRRWPRLTLLCHRGGRVIRSDEPVPVGAQGLSPAVPCCCFLGQCISRSGAHRSIISVRNTLQSAVRLSFSCPVPFDRLPCGRGWACPFLASASVLKLVLSCERALAQTVLVCCKCEHFSVLTGFLWRAGRRVSGFCCLGFQVRTVSGILTGTFVWPVRLSGGCLCTDSSAQTLVGYY